MIYLLIVSLIWGFSFGLIKNNLVGIDSFLVSFLRISISFLLFLPFIKKKHFQKEKLKSFIPIGFVQFGLMYIFYINAYQYLKAYEIALFTIFTPIYITVINDLIKRTFNKKYFIISVLSVVGTAVIKYEGISNSNFLLGFILIQLSNISFAAGQILYKNACSKFPDVKDKDIFGIVYLGGVLATSIGIGLFTDFSNIHINNSQILSLIYLGVVASGIGFFLWNYGVRKVNVGTLAVFNNLKIPIGIIISILIFNESTDFVKLIIGAIILFGALYINEKKVLLK